MFAPRLILHRSIALLCALSLFCTDARSETVNDFEGGAGATPAVFIQGGDPPGPSIVLDGDNNVLRLLDGVNSQNNRYVFDLSDPGAFETISATFDFRITPGSNGLADGFHFMLIPTSAFGFGGDGPAPTAEEPNVPNAFAVGFDVYPGINNVSAHWNGFQVNELAVPRFSPGVDFRTNGLFNAAQIDLQRVGNGSNLTISLIGDSLGEFPAFPYKVMEITMPNMLPYENRVQFGGRTGGENLRLDLDNINVTYSNPYLGGLPDAPAGKLFQDFDSVGATGYRAVQAAQRDDVVFRPGPLIKPAEPGSNGAFLRIVNDAVTGQTNRVAVDRAFDGGASNQIEVLEFDLRFNSSDDPADGLGLLFLPTANAVVGAVGDGVGSSEEPNFPGALGIGFDVYPNGGTDVAPGVSVHWNGTKIADVPLPAEFGLGLFHGVSVIRDPVPGGITLTVLGVYDVNGFTGPAGEPVKLIDGLFIAGAHNYDHRVQFSARTGGSDADHDIDSIASFQTPKLLLPRTEASFNTPEESSWKAYRHALGLAPEIRNDLGPNGNYFRLIHDGQNGQQNAIAFHKQQDGSVENAIGIGAAFDFRISSATGPGADGLSMVFVPTETYGDFGAGISGTPGFVAEEPNLFGVFAIAFDLFNTFEAPSLNEVSVHWSGSVWHVQNVDPVLIDLDSGAFHRLQLELRPGEFETFLTLTLTPDVMGVPGAPVTVFNEVAIPGFSFYDYRMEFSGRTGGLNMTVDLDNIMVQTLYIPEPGSAALLSLGALYFLRRPRRKTAAA